MTGQGISMPRLDCKHGTLIKVCVSNKHCVSNKLIPFLYPLNQENGTCLDKELRCLD